MDNFLLYFLKLKYVKNLISLGSQRAYKYHRTRKFIDDLHEVNGGNEFSNLFKNIYFEELELELKHQGPHATFLDFDITIKDNVFIYKLFDKRDKFLLFIVRMPPLSSNIPSSIFYCSFYSELFRIARCTLIFLTLYQKHLKFTIEWSFKVVTLSS